MKLFFEVLKLEAEMSVSDKEIITRVTKADGTMDSVAIKVKELIPMQSEFEQARRRTIKRLNGYMVNEPARLKQLYADFETESVWELSSKITNHVIDSTRRARAGTEFKLN